MGQKHPHYLRLIRVMPQKNWDRALSKNLSKAPKQTETALSLQLQHKTKETHQSHFMIFIFAYPKFPTQTSVFFIFLQYNPYIYAELQTFNKLTIPASHPLNPPHLFASLPPLCPLSPFVKEKKMGGQVSTPY